MSKRPPRPPQTPWLSPYLAVKDSDAALGFYQRAFGFQQKLAMKGPDGRSTHAEMTWQDALIMFGPEDSSNSDCKAPASSGVRSPVQLYVYCENVDALCDRARAAGATVELAPQDMFWGDRICRLRDPDGHLWCFATNVADFDPATAPH